MQYNVIVKAEIRRSLAKPDSLDISTGMGRLLSELFANQVKIVSEGVLRSSRDGRITLTFTGENGNEIKISFSKKDPSLIALTRNEPHLTTIFLEEGARRRCVGKSPSGDHLEFTVITETVCNKLLKSGKLILDYAIEICGVRAENSFLSLTVVHDKSEES